MRSFQIALLLGAAALFGPSAAVPTATVITTVTVTKQACTTPSGCISVCPTPTTTVRPTNCPKILIACPLVKCAITPTITSTSTHYCRGTSCEGVYPTTSCEDEVAPVTVLGKCQVGCPEPCPIITETKDLACPTSVSFI